MAFSCISCKSNIDSNYKACPFCGEPITDFLRRYLETPIDGKYQILSRLGIGGMGEVYKVLHIHLNSIRVIKMMRPNLLTEQGAHERFVREARLATRIHHPNVATLYDFSTLDDGSYYMVWEFISGRTLADLLRSGGTMLPRYVAQIACQALAGLDAIHRVGVVHRDISPENLMITRDEEGDQRLKIIDLGIAKQWGDSGDDKTKTGMFVGKWKYCSPEHLGILKEGERIDGRADLYSFGIVLYELFSGSPPFVADAPHRYLMMHANEAPKPLGLENAELEAIVFRALAKDRTQRFATAREMAKALEAIIPSLPELPVAPVTVEKPDYSFEVPPSPDSTTLKVTVGASGRAASTATTVNTTAPGADQYKTQPQSQDTEKAAPLPGQTTEIAATLVVPIPARRRIVVGGAVAASLLMVAIVVSMLRKDRPDAPIGSGAVVASLAVTTPAQARLGINAFPWGEVVQLKNLQNQKQIEFPANLMTPAALDLPPGKYELLLRNPNYKQPRSEVIELSAGQQKTVMVQFAEPSALPRFEAKSP